MDIRAAARRAAACSAVAGALTLAAAPAAAHPFGPPPTALVSASGREVVVEWGAAPDDALIVGMAIGILDDGSLERYLEGPVQTAPSAAQEQELSASPDLRAYLLERIAVVQDDRPCEGTVAPIDSFVQEGARLEFRCPAPVRDVVLRIAMLHDVHESYRTFAVTEGRGRPAQSVFTVDNAEQAWDFRASPRPDRDGAGDGRGWAWPGAPAFLGAAGLATLGAVLWRRRG